ncbi:MAG: 50S ribosomal protein L25 [Spirochaetota bacterium]
MQSNTLTVMPRTEFGKNASHRLRKAGFIPSVVYSHGEAESIKIPIRDFNNLFKGYITESVLIDLVFPDDPDKKVKAFVKDYHKNPVNEEVLHVDFFKITAGEAIQTSVHLEFVGSAAGERMGGILEVIERELAIEVLPADMPEKIEIDVTNLEIGDSIHVRDLEAKDSLTFLVDADQVIITCVAPHMPSEEEAEELAEGEEAVETSEGAAESEGDEKE